jgi:hypothetical protein
MCNRLSSVVTVILALAPAALAAGDPPLQGKPSDADIRRLIVGKWAQEIKSDNGVTVKGTTTYKSDGTFTADATFSVGGQDIRITLEGTWKVADGVIAETIQKSSFPGVPSGQTSKDHVLSISQKSLERKDEQGKRTTQTRVGN